MVENAIKYTAEGGRVTLRARPEGDGGRVAIEVEDTGQGISAEDLPHIFERFYRGRTKAYDDSGEQEVPGIGLGLHLARVLVEGMGGSIEASSRGGRGSTFTLLLPIWRDETRGEGGDRDGGSINAAAEDVTGGEAKREALRNG